MFSRLDHPNIVRMLEAGEAGDLPYIAMEWLPGGTLTDRLCGGPLPPGEAVCIGGEARRCRPSWPRTPRHPPGHPAVQHRVRWPWRAVIVDFGIAKRLDRPYGTTRNGAMVGDPRYMAPEQWFDGARRVGPAVDVHGIGAILYHAITGRLPFEGVCLLERLAKTHATVPPPAALCPSLPPALDRICLRCLGPRPGDRYDSAAELADELRGVYDSGRK